MEEPPEKRKGTYEGQSQVSNNGPFTQERASWRVWRSVPADVRRAAQRLCLPLPSPERGPVPPSIQHSLCCKVTQRGIWREVKVSTAAQQERWEGAASQRRAAMLSRVCHVLPRSAKQSKGQQPHLPLVLSLPGSSREVDSKLSYVITWELLTGEHLTTKRQLVNFLGGGKRSAASSADFQSNTEPL